MEVLMIIAAILTVIGLSIVIPLSYACYFNPHKFKIGTYDNETYFVIGKCGLVWKKLPILKDWKTGRWLASKNNLGDYAYHRRESEIFVGTFDQASQLVIDYKNYLCKRSAVYTKVIK